MVKLISPLHSYSAHGKFGDVVYAGRYARQYVKPIQANTENQGNTRQAFKAAQKSVTACGTTTRANLRTLYGSNWFGSTLGRILGPALTTWTTMISTFNNLTSEQRTNWDTTAEASGITDTSIAYAGDAPASAGLSLYALSITLFTDGLCDEPTGDNSTTIAGQITA